jgi:ABC-type nitrate/sulfonate/bicarbonate transport system permease component
VSETTLARRARPVRHRWARRPSSAVYLLLLILGGWELAGALTGIRVLSRPSEVVAASWLYLPSGELLYNLAYTLLEVFLGMVLAIAIGWPLGLLLGWNRTLYAFTNYLLMSMNATPRSALIPLIAVWFGVGIAGKTFIMLIAAIFPIIVNVATGVRTLDPTLLRLAHSFGARPSDLWLKILLPATVPHFLTSLRLGISRGLTGVILAEMYVSFVGMGRLMVTAGASLRADALIFLAIVTGLVGFGLVQLVYALERRWTPWFQDRL